VIVPQLGENGRNPRMDVLFGQDNGSKALPRARVPIYNAADAAIGLRFHASRFPRRLVWIQNLQIQDSEIGTRPGSQAASPQISRHQIQNQKLGRVKMTDQNLGKSNDKSADLDSPNLKPLSPWNPLDHLRLLCWVLVFPERLIAYQAAWGEDALFSVGKWLSSTLAWLPPLILVLGLGVGPLPSTQTTRLPHPGYFWAGVGLALILAWALTGWLREETGCLTIAVALGIALLILASGMAFRVMGSMITSIEAVLAVGLALGVAVGIAPVVPGGVPNIVPLFVAGIATIVGGRSAFLVAFVLQIVVVGRVQRAVRESLETGRPSWIAQGAFAALVIAYILLVWFSFLSGWQVFR
jgi:hypothetical protein